MYPFNKYFIDTWNMPRHLRSGCPMVAGVKSVSLTTVYILVE